jgi:hypothetical protein
MHAPSISRPARLVLTFAAVTSLTGAITAVPAQASVYSTCTMSTCTAARSAKTIWSGKGYPTTSGWYSWPDGKYNYTGGRHYNREGQLPSATYYEYDVYSRAMGAARDAYRIVVNRSTGVVYFSPNHYTDFYKL